MNIDFKGSHFPKEVITYAIYCYARFSLSFRDIEELSEERGLKVDHATVQRIRSKVCETHKDETEKSQFKEMAC